MRIYRIAVILLVATIVYLIRLLFLGAAVALFRHTQAPMVAQHAIPHTRSFDSTGALFLEGYRFVTRRCDLFDSDIFATRFMLCKAFCVRGEEAARMFYEPGRFVRRQA